MLLILTGHPRSGTTLLQRLCNSHPALSVTNEFGCFRYLDRPFAGHAQQMLAHWRDVGGNWSFNPVNASSAHRHWYNLRFTLRYLSRLGMGGNGRITHDRVHHTYQGLFPEAHLAGDKLPLYLYSLDRFLDAEEVKCVVIYRDCRDVTSSFLRKVRTDWQEQAWVQMRNTAAKIAQRWLQGIEQMERHADQIHIIRYETLVQQPAPELVRLAHWLVVDPAGFDASMVQPDKIGKHRHGLTETELADVMAIAGPTLARLGYCDDG